MSKTAQAVIGRDYSTLVVVGEHEILSDESVEVGGKDTGPNPYELLMSSLASCTAITLRMYADRHPEWEVPCFKVEVEHAGDHCKDCSEVENEDATPVHVFKRTISMEGDIDENVKQRMLNIANKCPVHKLLTGDIEVHTEMI